MAVKELGAEKLCALARTLTGTIRENATIDWSARESSRARLRLQVKLLLRRSGYPADLVDRAAQTAMEQAGLLTREPAA